jgi:hypothetical protein
LENAIGPVVIDEGTEEGAQQNAGEKLNQDHRHAGRWSAMTIGEHEERDPDPEFRSSEKGVRETDLPKDSISEG